MRPAPSFRTGSPAPSCYRRWTGRCTKRWRWLRPGYQDQSPEAHEQPDHVARGEVLPVAEHADDHEQQRGGDVRDHGGEADLPPGAVGEQDGELHSHDRQSHHIGGPIQVLERAGERRAAGCERHHHETRHERRGVSDHERHHGMHPGGALAESVPVVLVLVVAALVWNALPLARTFGWVGAVTAAAALRTWWRLGLGRRAATPEQALRGVRLTVAGVGLAWGFGAAAAIPELGLAQAALILVVLAGITAGATGTLVGDRRSFRYLLITTLAPLPVGILLQGHGRIQLIAILLTALFAWSMDRVHRRAHRTFAERV